MRAGDVRNVTLALFNGGEAANFMLRINTVLTSNDSAAVLADFLEYTLMTPSTFLEDNSSTEINIELVLTSNVTDGRSVTFTVVAESDTGGDNFVSFRVITTSNPPQEFTENVSL